MIVAVLLCCHNRLFYCCGDAVGSEGIERKKTVLQGE